MVAKVCLRWPICALVDYEVIGGMSKVAKICPMSL
jgi:hypothetical protein